MSSVSSNQSFVCDGVGYDEVFLLGQKDLDNSSEERNLFATSPSSRDEGLEMDRPEGDSSDGLDDAEPPIQSVIGPDGLREFIMLCRRLMILGPQSKNFTSKHLGLSTKYSTTYLSVYPIS